MSLEKYRQNFTWKRLFVAIVVLVVMYVSSTFYKKDLD